MEVKEALTEAAKGMPSISNLPLADLLSMKQQMEILQSNVFQILNPQPTMPVQIQAIHEPMTTTTQSDSGCFFGSSSHFGRNDDVNPNGATPF
nr:MADS-box transcription factor 23-like [Ipomoea trifida]